MRLFIAMGVVFPRTSPFVGAGFKPAQPMAADAPGRPHARSTMYTRIHSPQKAVINISPKKYSMGLILAIPWQIKILAIASYVS